MRTIERTEYLNRIKGLKDTPDIKVITGIRRSGKSILMQEYIQYLKEHFSDINVIFMCHQLISHPEKIEKRAENPLKIILL